MALFAVFYVNAKFMLMAMDAWQQNLGDRVVILKREGCCPEAGGLLY